MFNSFALMLTISCLLEFHFLSKCFRFPKACNAVFTLFNRIKYEDGCCIGKKELWLAGWLAQCIDFRKR